MGAKFDCVEGTLPFRIKDGVFQIIDYSGKVYEGKININIEVNWNLEQVQENVLARVNNNKLSLVLQNGQTYSLVRKVKDCYEILDIGVYDFDYPKLFEKEYLFIGYCKHEKRHLSLHLDKTNNMVHALKFISGPPIRHFKYKGGDFNYTPLESESLSIILNNSANIGVYTKELGLLPSDLFEEIDPVKHFERMIAKL